MFELYARDRIKIIQLVDNLDIETIKFLMDNIYKP